MSEKEIEILREFKTQMINFFDELIALFPSEGDLVIIRLFLDNQVPVKEVMDIFNYKINKNDQELKKMVKDRNDIFFLEHGVFDELDKNKVNHFKRIWRSNTLDNDDKNIIWKWIDTFIYLADKYTKVIKSY